MLVDQLPSLSAPQDDDEIPIERGRALYKIKVGSILEQGISFQVSNKRLIISIGYQNG